MRVMAKDRRGEWMKKGEKRKMYSSKKLKKIIILRKENVIVSG